jgi:hypothetical protein
MPLPELLDELFRLYRRNFGIIVTIALIVVVPGLIWTLVTGTYLLTTSTFSRFLTSGGTATPSEIDFSNRDFTNLLGLVGLGLVGALFLVPFTLGAIYRAITDIVLGRPVSIAAVFRATLARYFPLWGLIGVVILVLIGCSVLLALLAVITPILAVIALVAAIPATIYFAIRFSPFWLTVAAMMAEDIGPIQGLGRSWNLVEGMWWRVFGIAVVLYLLQAIIGGGLGLLYRGIVAVLLTGGIRLAVDTIGSTLLDAVVSPIGPLGAVLLYFDLRVRKEGLDLDQLAQQTSPGPATA